MTHSGTVRNDLPDDVRDLPPAARFVFYVLVDADATWVSYEDVQAATGYSRRGTSDALQTLSEAGVVTTRRRCDDARKHECRLVSGE